MATQKHNSAELAKVQLLVAKLELLSLVKTERRLDTIRAQALERVDRAIAALEQADGD